MLVSRGAYNQGAYHQGAYIQESLYLGFYYFKTSSKSFDWNKNTKRNILNSFSSSISNMGPQRKYACSEGKGCGLYITYNFKTFPASNCCFPSLMHVNILSENVMKDKALFIETVVMI